MGIEVPKNGLHVLGFAEHSLYGQIALLALPWLLTNEQCESEATSAQMHRLEELVQVGDADTKTLRLARALVKKLTSRCKSLTFTAEQGKMQRYTLAACMRKLEVDGTSSEGEFAYIFQSVQSLKNRVTVAEFSANNVKVQACKTLHKMPRLRWLVDWLTQTVSNECGQVANKAGV